MAQKIQKTSSKPIGKSTVRSTAGPTNNVYKKGKLSKNARFSPRKINWTPIIILACLFATFIFAIIFGNILGKKAENSQNTTPPTSDSSSLVPPSADKVSPRDKLNAYFADMTGADPENSLSELTSDARDKGNALFINLKNNKNELIYSSEKSIELGFAHQENLTLSRLGNHFEYYDDFAVGYFISDFSASLDTKDALKLQTTEILLLKEATKSVFDQIIVEFSGNFTKSNLIHYQSYLLNLKLACPDTPIGVKISHAFLTDPNNAGSVSALLGIADFFALDLGTLSADEIKTAIAPLVYFTKRYDCVIMISDDNEIAIEEKVASLNDKGINNYIVY